MKKLKKSHLLPWVVGLVGAFAFMHVYSVQAILPILMRDFHASHVAAGLSVGAAVFGMAITSPFMGMLSDALGRKWLILLSIFILTAPTLWIASAQTIETVIFWRFLQGISVPGITVTLLAYVGEEFRGQVMAKLLFYYVSGTVLGGFSGRFLLGHLSEFMSWRDAMRLLALLNVVGIFLVWKMLPPSKHFVPKPLRHARQMLLSHLHNRYLLSASALGFGVLFSLVGSFTFVNLYLAEAPFFLTSGQLANIFAVYLIGMVITPWSALLIKRFAAPRTILLAIAISVSGVIVTGGTGLALTLLALAGGALLIPRMATLAKQIPRRLLLLGGLLAGLLLTITGGQLGVVICGLVLISSGVFITQSATISYIAQHVTEGRSLATGIYYSAYYFGGTVGSWLCGLAYDYGNWHGVMVVLLAMQMVALSIAYFFMLRGRGADFFHLPLLKK